MKSMSFNIIKRPQILHFMNGFRWILSIILYECEWIFPIWGLSKEWDLAFGKDLSLTHLIFVPSTQTDDISVEKEALQLLQLSLLILPGRPCRRWQILPFHKVKELLVILIQSGHLGRTRNILLGNSVLMQSSQWPNWVEGREENQLKVSFKVNFTHLILLPT